MHIAELIAVLSALQLRDFTHVEFPSGMILHSHVWGIRYVYEPDAQRHATTLLQNIAI